MRKGVNLRNLTRHLIGLYQGEPGARKYRQMLSGVVPKNNFHFFDEIIKTIGDFDALLVRSQTQVTQKIIDAAKNLKVIGRAGVGTVSYTHLTLPTNREV